VLASSAIESSWDFAGDLTTSEILRRVAETFCEQGGADGATVCMSEDNENVAVVSTEPDKLVCDKVVSCGFGDCPNSIAEGKGVVLRGERSSWPTECRTLPESYAKFVEVHIHISDSSMASVVLGYRNEQGNPTTKHLACLRGLAKSVGPVLARVLVDKTPKTVEYSKVVGGTDEAGRLRISCFGSFQVSLHGKVLPRKAFVRGKAVELLKLLVMNRGRPLTRDCIVEELWPTKTLEAGSKSFHVTIHALRKAIEPSVKGREWVHVRNQGDGYFFDYSSPCWVDLERFTQLLNDVVRVDVGRENDKEVGNLLGAAIELYSDELFSDELEGDRWEAQRSALRRQYVDALVHLARLSGDSGQLDRGVALIMQAVGVEPWREENQCVLIRTLWNAGRRDEARKHYDYVMSIIDRQPSDEMKSLHGLIH